MDKLEEMDRFLEKFNLPRLNQEEIKIINNTFLNNQQLTEEIKREIKKLLETNDNENTTQNLWDATKAVL